MGASAPGVCPFKLMHYSPVRAKANICSIAPSKTLSATGSRQLQPRRRILHRAPSLHAIGTLLPRDPHCLGLQMRVSANRVCQVERRGLLVLSIERKSLLVAWRCLCELSLIAKNIGDMPDCVRQQKRVVLRAAKFNRIGIVPQSQGRVSHVSLNLSQSCERLRQQNPVVRLPAPFHCVGKIILGLGQPSIAACFVAAREQFSWRDRHHGERVACRRYDCRGRIQAARSYSLFPVSRLRCSP